MQKNEFTRFADVWADAHEIMAGGKVFSNRAMVMIFEALEGYPLYAVVMAIGVHVRQSRFAPTPADIVEIINDHSRCKHVGAEEAWAIALESFDESRSVVWTDEIAQARNIAWTIFAAGDEVGARMAFREAYKRIVSVSANEARWLVSQGFDKEQAADVVAAAVRLGRLPAGADAKYRIEAPTTTTQKLIEKAQKITGKVDALAKIRLIRSVLEIDDGDDAIARREAKRLAFEGHRRSMLDRAQQKLDDELPMPKQAVEVELVELH